MRKCARLGFKRPLCFIFNTFQKTLYSELLYRCSTVLLRVYTVTISMATYSWLWSHNLYLPSVVQVFLLFFYIHRPICWNVWHTLLTLRANLYATISLVHISIFCDLLINIFFSTFTCLIRCFVAVQLASFFFVPLYHLYQRQLWKQSFATFIEKKNFWFVSGVATLVQLHRIRQFQFNAITFACFLALEKNISIGNSVCACRQTFGMLFITKWTSFGNFVLLYVEKCNFLLQNIGVGTVESGFKISVEFLLCLNEQRTT